MTARTLQSGDDLDGETLEGALLEADTLEKATFADCTFVDLAWTRATLRRCLFESCVFRGCDLTMVSPYDTSFRGVRFERCKLMGIDWTKSHQLTFDVSFVDSVLSYCTFDAMLLRGLSMTGCKAIEAVFTEADLTGADLAGTDLTGSTFLHTVLEETDLSLATGYQIDPTTNRLRDTRFALDGALRSLALLGIRVPDVNAGD